MYKKLIVNRYGVKLMSMSKMNVKSGKIRKKALGTSSTEEKDERYYYNQRRKLMEAYNLITINFKENYSCFVTLTFADVEISVEEASKTFERFINNLRKTYDNFKYVATAEFQDRGVIHYHFVCNITDEIDASNSISYYWNHGIIDVRNVYNIQGLAIYMTKKFTDQARSSNPLFGKRCYRTSQHLTKALVINSWKMLPEDFETIKNIITAGNAKKRAFINNVRAGKIEYATYKLDLDSNTIFGNYTLAKRKKHLF
ncbi:hypothetical protein D9O40_14220 [Clostridium autoethanogenum]|uniref:Replication-associated protein ORF2/G2P domain-containing protein n=1 Tax=Clostridium autoethanogenum TaxID=84023 RepID=A0A3M0SH05_9CLOT|nr:hypothetical protein [Clostridium autoethanogenum]RMC97782.1 hypothetical protein D9O40_14220 [Clostridium autoethanogenum]